MKRKSYYDVLIVGFGPVGAVAASLLGATGLSTLVIDRSVDIYDKPRAVALDHEIARIFQNLGLADALDRVVAPFSPSEYFGVDGQLIKRLDMLPPPFPLSWTPSMVFMQPALEQALRAHVGGLASVDVALGVEFMRLEQRPGSVLAELRDEHGVSTVEAQYVLACDGASSSVRRQLGVTFDDLAFDQPWLVVDVMVNDSGLTKLPIESAQFCEPARPTSYIIATGRHRRWEFMLLPGEDPRQMEEPLHVWRLLGRWLGPDDGTLWRATSYRFHAVIAQAWRDRRVLIAGDAAHQQPPFLGQGLCQGIRDAANLAWKLDRVIKRQSGPALLDTYQTERAAHVRDLIGTIKSIGAIVSERDEQRAMARDARLLSEAGGVVRSQPRQDLMPALQTGCLGAPGTARGTTFPQPMITTPAGLKRLDNLAGCGFRVVLSAEAPAPDADLRSRIASLGGRIVHMSSAQASSPNRFAEADGIVARWFKRHGASAAIVRPDHYVFATTTNLDDLACSIADLERALS